MSKAYGYVRVSTDKQAQKGLSLDAQEKKIKQYANECEGKNEPMQEIPHLLSSL